MLGKIVKWLGICTVCLAIGWTGCILLSKKAPYLLTREINLTDLLAILADIILTCVIATVLTKRLDNNRTEKDYLINELGSLSETMNDLEQQCYRNTVLSFQNTVYALSKARKILMRVQSKVEEYHKSFHKNNKQDFENIRMTIIQLNSKLTDSTYFSAAVGYTPIRIARNNIYLNNTVKPDIDNSFSSIRDGLLSLKLKLNRI